MSIKPAAGQSFISFHILGDLPASGDERYLLSSSLLGSAIDLYEALLTLAKISIMESRPAAGQILEVCEELSSEIVDARLDAILFLGGHADRAACLVAANTDLRDAKLFEGASPGRVRQGGVISAVAVGHRQAALAVMCRG